VNRKLKLEYTGILFVLIGVIGLSGITEYVFVKNDAWRDFLWLLYLWPGLFLMLMVGIYLIRYSRRMRRKLDPGPPLVTIQD